MNTMQKTLEAARALNVKDEAPVRAHLPAFDLLKDYQVEASGALAAPEVLEARLGEFGLQGKVVNIRRGPVVSRYEVKLAPGVKLAKVRNVAEDLSVSLAGKVRILAPIPGTSLVGFEVVNERPAVTGLKKVLEWCVTMPKLPLDKSNSEIMGPLPIMLGVDTSGMPRYIDLTKMPHLLVAGQTGSGKSVFLNTLILSILFLNLPAQCRLILVDPKRVEMAAYRGIPHLMRPVVTDAQEAMLVFSWLVDEMERRYRVLETNHVRNIDSYNALQNGTMPYIVAVVDEMADLMMTSGKYLESMIVRLAQLARAVGIHLVLATQKPIVKVITGLIKSNMSTRIAFAVSSKMDSRVILDVNGAEHLAGKGDMLMLAPGMQEPERFHGAWVSDEEIQAVAKRITIGG